MRSKAQWHTHVMTHVCRTAEELRCIAPACTFTSQWVFVWLYHMWRHAMQMREAEELQMRQLPQSVVV